MDTSDLKSRSTFTNLKVRISDGDFYFVDEGIDYILSTVFSLLNFLNVIDYSRTIIWRNLRYSEVTNGKNKMRLSKTVCQNIERLIRHL